MESTTEAQRHRDTETAIAAAPPAAATGNFTIEAQDSTGATASRAFQLAINDPAVAPPHPGPGDSGNGCAAGAGVNTALVLLALAFIATRARRKKEKV